MEGDSLDALCFALDREEHDRAPNEDDTRCKEEEEKEMPGMIPQLVSEPRKENIIPRHNQNDNERVAHRVSRDDIERVLGSRSGSNGIGSLAIRKAAMVAKKARKEGYVSKNAPRKFKDVGQGDL